MDDILGTAVETIKTVGVVCGSLGAVLLALATVAKLRPVRWLNRTLIRDPLSNWFRNEVHEAVKGAHETMATELAGMHAEISEINKAVNRKEPGQPTLAERVADIEAIVKGRQSVVVKTGAMEYKATRDEEGALTVEIPTSPPTLAQEPSAPPSGTVGQPGPSDA